MPRPSSHHECAKPGCAEMVPNVILACRPHWYELPEPLRADINSAYRDRGGRGGAGRHLAAVAEAMRVWMEAPHAST